MLARGSRRGGGAEWFADVAGERWRDGTDDTGVLEQEEEGGIIDAAFAGDVGGVDRIVD